MNHLVTMKRFVSFILPFCTCYLVAAFINKYAVEVENVEVCPNNDKLPCPITKLKYVRYNRTQRLLNFDFTYDRPIDENVGGSFSLEKWADGAWKAMPFLGFQPNICKALVSHFNGPWVSFLKSAGVEDPGHCPIPAGNYSLKNYVFNATQLSIPFWSGRFRLTMKYEDVKTRKLLFCTLYYAKITEQF